MKEHKFYDPDVDCGYIADNKYFAVGIKDESSCSKLWFTKEDLEFMLYEINGIGASNCIYKKIKSDGWGDTWKTNCGNNVYCESPDDVGMQFAPLPTNSGNKYCSFCGKGIQLENK